MVDYINIIDFIYIIDLSLGSPDLMIDLDGGGRYDGLDRIR